MVIKVFKKLLVCICIVLIIINCTLSELSFASDDLLKTNFEEELTKDDEGIGDKITQMASGIVGLLTYPYRLLAIAASTIIQTLGALVANTEGKTDPSSEAIITLTPDDILFNKINLTDINFFNIDGLEEGTIKTIRKQIAMWYYIMRMIAIIILLVILLIVGIRMAITTVASEKAIYKKALFDWVTSLALVFLLHFLIRGIIWINAVLVDMIANAANSSAVSDVFDAFVKLLFHVDFVVGWASVIIYCMLTVQTLMFLITYIKRMLTLAFLIIISPLISITYSLDKMGDQKAQALNTWLKEFSYNVLIQPFHCILYLVFASTAISAATTDGSVGAILLSMLCMKFVWDGEKIVRKIFGFEQASSLGTVAASGAMIGAALSKARSAGSTVKSGVKFAKNTKTGQMVKSKFNDKVDTFRKNRAASQITGKKTNYASLNKEQKALADKRANDMKEHKTPIRRMKERKEYDRLKKKAEENGINISEAGLRNKASENVKKKSESFKKDHPLRAAMLEDGKKFARKMYSPEKSGKIAAAVMAGAMMYALPEQNLLGAATMGYATGKSVETGIRNIKDRKKESFEENVLKAWERHCSINKVPEDKRTKENFENWYNNTYLKGKDNDAYSNKNMSKEKGEAEKELSKLGLEKDIDSILAKMQKAVLNKEGYNPEELFKGYSVPAADIAAAIQGYASMFNESYVYQQSSSYNEQMNPYGVTSQEAISGISEEEVNRSSSSSPQINSDTTSTETRETITEELHENIDSAIEQAEDTDTPEDILHKLEEDVKNQLQEIETELKTVLSGLETDLDSSKITTEIERAVKLSMNDVEKDVNKEIETAIQRLGLTGDVANKAREYGTRCVERHIIENNTETIIQEIRNRRNSNTGNEE